MTIAEQQRRSQQSHGSPVNVKVEGLTPDALTFITLQGGMEIKLRDAELVQFVVSNSNSPILPQKTYPALRYVNEQTGRVTWTPLSQIAAFSTK